MTFTGRGNCLSTRENYPEPGINGFRCYLDLTDLPPEYVGGQLTTNTIVRALNVPAGIIGSAGLRASVDRNRSPLEAPRRRVAGRAPRTRSTARRATTKSARASRRATRWREMSPARILRTLDFGLMMSIAYPMKRDEREAVAAFLGKGADEAAPPASALCTPDTRIMSGASQASWTGWGPSQDNARFQPAERAGLSAADIPRLELKWAFGFAGDIIAFAAPTVVERHAVRRQRRRRRASARCEDRLPALDLSGERPRAHRDDGRDGRRADGRCSSATRTAASTASMPRAARCAGKRESRSTRRRGLTGSFAVHDGVAFVPAASWEETRSIDPAYPCCTFRGSVTAVRVRDGSVVWKTYLVDAPQRTGKTAVGHADVRPVGRGRLVDADRSTSGRGLLYVTTGDNYSHPATATSDAVVALELATGRIVWSQQTTPNDVYNSSCGSRGANCPEDAGPDYDFGSSAMLVRTPNGTDVLVAGQKSGVVYALDPANGGKLLWQTRVGKGGTNGGVQWGMASDGRNVYAAVSDVVRLQNVERRGAGRLRAARPRSKAAASRRSTLRTASASGSRRARRARRRAWAAAPRNRPP